MTETPTTRGPDDPESYGDDTKDPDELVVDDPAEGTTPDPATEDDHQPEPAQEDDPDALL